METQDKLKLKKKKSIRENGHFRIIIVSIVLIVFISSININTNALSDWESVGFLSSFYTSGFGMIVLASQVDISHGVYTYPADFDNYDYAAFVERNGSYFFHTPIYKGNNAQVAWSGGSNYNFNIILCRKLKNKQPQATINPTENKYFG